MAPKQAETEGVPRGSPQKGPCWRRPLVLSRELSGKLARGDCLLLLWTTGWAIATGQAQEVARAWSFKPISEIVWLKRYPSGKARIGTGYRLRTMHEPILVCAVGNPRHKPFPSTFHGIAREHSRKPSEFYDLVLSHTPQAIRRADLFSRETPPGFDGWGKRARQIRRELGHGRCWLSHCRAAAHR